MTLKETIRKNFLNTMNDTVRVIKENPETKAAYELADFLADYTKEMGSLLYCYEFITEEDHDNVVGRGNTILAFVKSKQSGLSRITEGRTP